MTGYLEVSAVLCYDLPLSVLLESRSCFVVGIRSLPVLTPVLSVHVSNYNHTVFFACLGSKKLLLLNLYGLCTLDVCAGLLCANPHTPLVAKEGKLSTATMRANLRYKGFWYFVLCKDWLEMVNYKSRMWQSSVFSVSGTRCHSQPKKVLGTLIIEQIGGDFPSGKTEYTVRYSGSFGCCLQNCMKVRQLAVIFFMSLEMPEQKRQSFAFRSHVFVPIWPWWTMCNICGCILLGITRQCPLSTRSFSFGSGHPWCPMSLRWRSTGSWLV